MAEIEIVFEEEVRLRTQVCDDDELEGGKLDVQLVEEEENLIDPSCLRLRLDPDGGPSGDLKGVSGGDGSRKKGSLEEFQR